MVRTIKKGIHWYSWDKVCRDKNDGGFDFRDLKNFKTTLLAKQLWRLIKKTESLFAKIFKGRYFRKFDPLDDHKSYSASFG